MRTKEHGTRLLFQDSFVECTEVTDAQVYKTCFKLVCAFVRTQNLPSAVSL
jgi:hypothetical protein